jgi:hypothetical protein
LAAQREALRLCEAQYGEAVEGLRSMMGLVQAVPRRPAIRPRA